MLTLRAGMIEDSANSMRGFALTYSIVRGQNRETRRQQGRRVETAWKTDSDAVQERDRNQNCVLLDPRQQAIPTRVL